MTRVLHVLEALGGGTARHLVDLVRHVPDVHQSVAVPPVRIGGVADPYAHGRLVGAGADVHLVEMRRSPVAPANARALRDLVRLCHAVKPDVIHGHASVGGALARVVGGIVRRPVVWTPHGVLVHPVATLVERSLTRLTSTVIALSPSEATLIAKLRLAPHGLIITIPNGVEADVDRTGVLDLRAHLGIPKDAPLVGTVARLVPQKAPEIYAQAWARVAAEHPDTHSVLIGQGSLAPEFDRMAAEIPRLHRIASVPDAGAVIDQLDVFVLTSRYEGAPYVPLEAMRGGVPVVLTDVVGSCDCVRHDDTGLLVPVDDPVALAAAINDLLHDTEKARRIAVAGQKHVAEHYSIDTMARLTGAVYADVVERNTKSSGRDR
ncbi:MAG TPA: glycosyltransferase [Mycobacteriales bacterium]|nr:glycosyltransferase [Mycobacteriales bacterium]